MDASKMGQMGLGFGGVLSLGMGIWGAHKAGRAAKEAKEKEQNARAEKCLCKS